jgi:hypothetical protein
VNLQILGPRNLCRIALVEHYLTQSKHTRNQLNATNIYIMNAKYDNEHDSENFGARITTNGVTVAKIWAFEVLGGKMVILEYSRGIFGITESFESFYVRR